MNRKERNSKIIDQVKRVYKLINAKLEKKSEVERKRKWKWFIIKETIDNEMEYIYILCKSNAKKTESEREKNG